MSITSNVNALLLLVFQLKKMQKSNCKDGMCKSLGIHLLVKTQIIINLSSPLSDQLGKDIVCTAAPILLHTTVSYQKKTVIICTHSNINTNQYSYTM